MVSDDRGQVLLVGSVVLAVTLIAIVVLLNGVAYTEHVGGGEQDSYEDAKRVQQSVETDLTEMGKAVLGDSSAETKDVGETTERLEENYITMLSTSSAATVRLSYTEASSQTTVKHDDGTGPFYPDTGAAPSSGSWDVLTNAEAGDISTFTMRIDPETLPNKPPSSTPYFTVEVGGDKLEMRRVAPTSNAPVDTIIPSSWNPDPSCSAQINHGGNQIVIDFVNGEISVGGSEVCEFDPVTGTKAIEFHGGGASNDIYPKGTYTLIFEGSPDLRSRSEYDSMTVSSSVPHVRQSLQFNFVYEAPTMTYESTIEVEVDDA